MKGVRPYTVSADEHQYWPIARTHNGFFHIQTVKHPWCWPSFPYLLSRVEEYVCALYEMCLFIYPSVKRFYQSNRVVLRTGHISLRRTYNSLPCTLHLHIIF